MLEQMIEVKEPPMSIAIVRYYWPGKSKVSLCEAKMDGESEWTEQDEEERRLVEVSKCFFFFFNLLLVSVQSSKVSDLDR